METINIKRILDETKGRMVTFSPGMEEGDKLTICVFGSDDGRTPHRLHFNGDKSVLAEETWPDDSFTYYGKAKSNDIVLK